MQSPQSSRPLTSRDPGDIIAHGPDGEISVGQFVARAIELAGRLPDHRYVINLADTVPDNPDDQFSGLLCHSFDSFWTNEAIAYQSDDVTAFLWPDKNDDGVADGYTVTTGVVTGVGDDNAYSLANPPTVTDAPRRAAICSQVGPVDCNGAGLGEFCNFLGFVDVQFTWHAENQ